MSGNVRRRWWGG